MSQYESGYRNEQAGVSRQETFSGTKEVTAPMPDVKKLESYP
jgi:hypothetical protein